MRLVQLICIPQLFFAVSTSVAGAERYYTFAGLGGSFGINRVTYHGWVKTEQKDLDISGSYYTAGPMLCVFIPPLIGEWTMQYAANSHNGEVDTSVQCLYLSLAGKYFYSVKQWFHLTVGAGVYGEMPPATLSYEGGGGGLASLGCIVNFNFDIRFVFDVTAKYGSFGLGEGSRKLSGGAAVSIIYNVGSI